MKTWKMISHYADPLDKSWDELTKICLGPSVHPERKRGFILSRMALKESLLELGHDLLVQDLKIHHYSELPRLPQFTLSLSHTKGGGAAIVANKNQFLSVGIDVEDRSRKVQDQVIQRIIHSQDLKLNKLELWCLKEAVFKSLMNSRHFVCPIDFSSIIIQKDHWIHPSSGLKGWWELKEESSLLVAMACIDLSPS